jgi:hypothetical protein
MTSSLERITSMQATEVRLGYGPPMPLRLAQDQQPHSSLTPYRRVARDQGGPEEPDRDPIGELLNMLKGAGLDRERSARACDLIRQIAGRTDLDPDDVPAELDAEDREGSFDPADYSSRYAPSAAHDRHLAADMAAFRQRRASRLMQADRELEQDPEIGPLYARLKRVW